MTPRPDAPCHEDVCGYRCFLDDDNGWCTEGTRGGNGDPEEDVLFACLCDHHEPPIVASYPCEADACGWTCERDGAGGFAREVTRGVADVMVACGCEHHEETKP